MTIPSGVHPAAAVFPPIEGEEFDLLVASIREKGLNKDIVLDPEGRILDGRNRLRACEAAGVVPRFTTYTGDDPVDFVRLQNLRRRDLNPSQRAAIGLELDGMEEQQAAKERQRESGRLHGKGAGPKVTAPGQYLSGTPGEAAEKIAEKAGVSTRTVYRLQRVQRERPELLDRVIAGDLSAKGAIRELEAPTVRVRAVTRVPEPELGRPLVRMVTRTGLAGAELLEHQVSILGTLILLHEKELTPAVVQNICQSREPEEVQKWQSVYRRAEKMLRSTAAAMRHLETSASG